MKINLSASQAEDKAKSAYSKDVEVGTARTELVVYSLGIYDNAPVYAYIVRVHGTSGGDYVDDSMFVNADNGTVINRASNFTGVVKTVTGINELESEDTFPVTPVRGNDGLYFELKDEELHIAMVLYKHINDSTWPRIRESEVILGQNKYDKHTISAYTNLRRTMSWWKTTFNRDSYNGLGSPVLCFTHRTPQKNLAEWQTGDGAGRILIDETASGLDYSPAAAFDILAHELTHGVFHNITHIDVIDASEIGNDMKAIDEAYSDIFACIQEEIWLLGRIYTRVRGSV